MAFKADECTRLAPSTRYQGSKSKLLPWIWENIRDLDFRTALDVFGGTGAVSYMLKTKGREVTYNDYLRFNALIGRALVENPGVPLAPEEAARLPYRDPGQQYSDFIANTFNDIFFTDEENSWLDTVAQNIHWRLAGYEQAIAYYALFQSCIIKRPYNLFHRKNLYMRTATVARSFGNKTTWDTPFLDHFLSFVAEANQAVFDSGIPCRALCHDALEVPGRFDLVYIDPPYVSQKGVGVDYLDFYHFLEGLADYDHWGDCIDYGKKHRPLRAQKSPWSDPRWILEAFDALVSRYAESRLVISYRSDGIPSEDELVSIVSRYKPDVRVIHYGQYKYVLSTNGASKELLLIAP
jgi:adenine-specific DNA methylase